MFGAIKIIRRSTGAGAGDNRSIDKVRSSRAGSRSSAADLHLLSLPSIRMFSMMRDPRVDVLAGNAGGIFRVKTVK